MSVNVTLAPAPPLSSLNSSHSSFYLHCQSCVSSIAVATAYTLCLALFLFPLALFVLSLGFCRWRRRRCVTHTDVLACHSATMEVFGAVGAALFSSGTFLCDEAVLMAGVFVYCVVFPGHTALHCLTCVEHYLAVVHPIAYRHLRQGAGLWARNAGLAGVWLLSFGWMGITFGALPEFPVAPTLGLLGVSLIVVLFFFLSVLHALSHPGPGGGGGARERVDPSKRRALRVISAIVGVLVLRFVGLLVVVGMYQVAWADPCVMCVLIDSGLFLSLPSSLVLPAIFLLRAGTLACWRHNTESG